MLYQIFSHAHAANHPERWLGEIEADDAAQALAHAKANYDCDDLHFLAVAQAPTEDGIAPPHVTREDLAAGEGRPCGTV